jgi:hypothetical protein
VCWVCQHQKFCCGKMLLVHFPVTKLVKFRLVNPEWTETYESFQHIMKSMIAFLPVHSSVGYSSALLSLIVVAWQELNWYSGLVICTDNWPLFLCCWKLMILFWSLYCLQAWCLLIVVSKLVVSLHCHWYSRQVSLSALLIMYSFDTKDFWKKKDQISSNWINTTGTNSGLE